MRKPPDVATLRPIAAGLWTEEIEPRLIGGKRISTGEIVFPMPEGDAAQHFEAVPLSRTGTIWSWTIQSFKPGSPPYTGPEVFEAFALGYVELSGQVIVETRFTQIENLSIGMPVELAIVPFNDTHATYAFRPTA
jgi:uncharacterized protein